MRRRNAECRSSTSTVVGSALASVHMSTRHLPYHLYALIQFTFNTSWPFQKKAKHLASSSLQKPRHQRLAHVAPADTALSVPVGNLHSNTHVAVGRVYDINPRMRPAGSAKRGRRLRVQREKRVWDAATVHNRPQAARRLTQQQPWSSPIILMRVSQNRSLPYKKIVDVSKQLPNKQPRYKGWTLQCATQQ